MVWSALAVAAGCGPDEAGGRLGAGPSAVAASPEHVFADDFESGTLAAWHDGLDPARHRIVTEPSGNRYLAATYPAGRDGGWLTHFLPANHDALQVQLDVRFPADWTGSTKLVALYGSRADDKWSAFGKAGLCPNGRDFFAAMLVTDPATDPGPLRFYTYYPAMRREPDGVTCWGRFGDGSETYSSIPVARGGWHRIEFSVMLNTPGRADASQQFRLDGVPRGSWSGFSFRDSDILRLNAVQLTFSANAEPQARELHIDNVSVRGVTAR